MYVIKKDYPQQNSNWLLNKYSSWSERWDLVHSFQFVPIRHNTKDLQATLTATYADVMRDRFNLLYI